MIVVKLLSDKSELDTADGRLTLGILLVRDALAIVVLALQPNLQHPSLAVARFRERRARARDEVMA